MYLSTPLIPGNQNKNRVYIWKQLVEHDKTKVQEGDGLYKEESEEEGLAIENDFYKGKAGKRK